MMEIKERLALSARPGKLTLIREGMFLKCYQQSLFSLVHSVYERNRGLPGIPGLEHTDSMPLTREEEDTGECTV